MPPFRNNLIDRSLRGFVNWLIHEKPLWLRIAPLLALALCIMSSSLWWGQIRNSHGISINTLTESFEDTRQSYKGLEAFVLSGLDEKFKKSIADYPVTEEFVSAFNTLQAEVPKALESKPDKLSESLTVEHPEANLITKKYITNKIGAGFFFIPGMLVGTSDPTPENILKEVTKANSHMKDDIVISQAIADNLRDLVSTKVIKVNTPAKDLVIRDKPVQSYFLSATGVIHLHEANVADVRGYYQRNFSPTFFFPDRPYFWDTVKNESTSGPIKETGPYTVGQIFKKTQPYIDLGGNGIVVTLSRGITGSGVESALLVDFSLGDEAKDFIKNRIEQLGGFAKETYCVVTDRKTPEPLVVCDDSLSRGPRSALQKHIENNSANLSVIFGNLYVFRDSSTPGTIVFTVPVGPQESREIPPGQTAATLLYCELDIDRYQRSITIKGIFIAVSFTALLFFIILLVREYVRKLNEQEEAFQSVGRVMSAAPVAYCRLNETDHFIEMNKAFAELLGYKDLRRAEKNLINRKTFESMLADEISKGRYKNIQAARTMKITTDPYSVRLKGRKKIVEVQVHGASVPMPKNHRKAIPQTFGLLVAEGVEVVSNRSIIVTPFFRPPGTPSKQTDLFVLMPFTPELTLVYTEHITDVAGKISLSISRADELISTRSVMSDVWSSICATRAIIADCTGQNSNVLYEVGIAHVVGKPVILITQNESDIPFDLRHIRHIVYEYTEDGMKKFESKLEEWLRSELGMPGVLRT